MVFLSFLVRFPEITRMAMVTKRLMALPCMKVIIKTECVMELDESTKRTERNIQMLFI